jgi:histidine triad (HIT) family protein
MIDCIFCKIVAGEMPCYKVYEDDLFFGFLDIFPRTFGHTLLIPKTHHRWTYDVPEFGAYWEAAKKIQAGMQKGLDPTFVTFVTHGLEVPHAHIHIMPRFHEAEFIPDVKKFSKEELEEVQKKIQAAIRSLAS